MVNYTADTKKRSKHRDNYTDDANRDTSKEKICCRECIFVGEYVGNNEYLARHHLCAKYIDEIANVKDSGTCDKALSAKKWYNRINPLKKWLLEQSCFKFMNR